MMVKIRLLLGVILFCLGIIFILSSSEEEKQNVEPYSIQDDYLSLFNFTPSPISLVDVLHQQRDLLQKELSDYIYPNNTQLINFTIADGGQPLRSIIITTWRSGSTFLGDILNSMPGNYYHYEPLLDYGIIQIRGQPLAKAAIQTLKNLLQCEYRHLENYLDYGKKHVYLFSHNTRLWNQCSLYRQYCWNSTFLTETCKLYPFQSMKVVRIRLKIAAKLLLDKELENVKIVLLIRDPRGTLQSRKHRDWCPGEPDCDQPNLLCSDMVSDYITSKRLMLSYPTRFRVIRYEDLSLNPYKTVKELFKFFGLHLHPQVINFLDSHTKLNAGGVSSTYRNSKYAPFHWKQELNYSEVQYIEENCDEAMKMWGYARVKNESQLRDFNPVTTLTFS